MGVHGLWQLLDSLGRPVSIESLENKVLAVDASFWIHQSIHGFRDRQNGGGPVHNAHLVGAFKRLCKLLFYRIRPVFVFDGSVPILKRETMAARRDRRADAARNAEKSRKEILSKHLKLKAIQEVMSNLTKTTQLDNDHPNSAGTSKSAVSTKRVDVDLYDLPPIPSSSSTLAPHLALNSDDEIDEEIDFEDEITTDDAGSELRSHLQDLEDIDLDSDAFGAMPFDIQHEILVELKEKLKRKSWTRLDAMPEDPEEIGKHQIRQLLRRRRVQQKLDAVSKKMSQSMLTADFDDSFQYAGRSEVRRIASDESSHYILLKNIVKKSSDTSVFQTSSRSDNEVGPASREITQSILESTKENSFSSSSSETSCYDGDIDEGNEKFSLSELKKSDEISIIEYQNSDKKIKEVEDDVDFNESRTDDAIVNSDSNSCGEIVTVTTLSESHKKIVDEFVSENRPMKTGVDLKISLPLPVISVIDEETDIDTNDGTDYDDDFVEVKPVSPNLLTLISDELFPLEVFQTSTQENKKENSQLVEIDSDPHQADLEDELSPIMLSIEVNNENLVQLGEQLQDEMTDLIQAKGRQERVAATITDEMYSEIQELLVLFGVPYLVSPAEAEAQCAALDTLDLTDGTITDDSDVWLFGARHVYKNFFNQDRHLLYFRDSDVQQRLGLDRRKLIAMALLMGSDYTEGVKGIGAVSAMELLAEFGGTSDIDGIECLNRFRKWWDENKENEGLKKDETKIKKSLRSVELHDGFPSPFVVNAYMEPNVDASTTRFSWARPDLHELRHFACSKLGWSNEKTDSVLLPVIKQLNAKSHQMHMTAYFQPTSSAKRTDEQTPPNPHMSGRRLSSKRLLRAIKRVRGNDVLNTGPTTSSKVQKSSSSKMGE